MSIGFVFLTLFIHCNISFVFCWNNGVKKPNIIFIVADDYGWGDVGFHGSQQVRTPNIDLLAGSGIILNNYYVSPICSPSRSAILTGYHPIHTGEQYSIIGNDSPWGTPLQFRLLSQHVKHLGYETHMLGKWHQGFFKRQYIPTQRGFDTHFGYWTDLEGYYTRQDEGGFDFRQNENKVNLTEYEGIYSTDIYTNKAIDFINRRGSAGNSTKPLFLYLAHQSVHSPNQAPQTYINQFNDISDTNRRTLVAMVSVLDDSVGDIFAALLKANILDNTIVIFTTDNGAPINDFGSNWPLRGGKTTLWEGGIRGNAFIWSTRLKKRYISDHLMHAMDWLPTIYTAIGGKTRDLGPIDGIDMWDILNHNLENPRKHLLHNIDPIDNNWALRSGDYKLIYGSQKGGSNWYLPPGDTTETGGQHIINSQNLPDIYRKSKVYKSLKKINLHSIKVKQILVKCNASLTTDCDLTVMPCLFNVRLDPCEYNNIYDQNPHIVKTMYSLLEVYNASAVPPGNQPADPRADPIYHDGWWSIWE